MSMLDSFFNKGFKAAKCKTLLKLTIPRIKLLRNRREIQIKQMRKDIAKLLETGQEATARIRVEHIVREENMMAAQEILELFCELIAVRLPIIETQRECPLDLKEAISTVCFAAPRCADLPELIQVQMLFAAKYGKEFVSAATELRPDCGVNRQIIELLSVRAPSPDVKLKLLKEIAEEHEVDWDPSASETEFSKLPEDLLNGPTQFVSGSKLPLPKEKNDETLYSSHGQSQGEQPESETDFDILDFPEVPKISVNPSTNTASAPLVNPQSPAAPHPEIYHEASVHSIPTENMARDQHVEPEELIQRRSSSDKDKDTPDNFVGARENKQFVPFISPPLQSSASLSTTESNSPPVLSKTKSGPDVDLQDVLAAAQAAAETAERAAAAARSAASLAQIRIAELTQKRDDQVPDTSRCENPFHDNLTTTKEPYLDHQDSYGDPDGGSSHQVHENHHDSESPDLPSFDKLKVDYDSPRANDHVLDQEPVKHHPQRLTSMDDETYFSYPNLFASQNSVRESGSHSSIGNSGSTHEL